MSCSLSKNIEANYSLKKKSLKRKSRKSLTVANKNLRSKIDIMVKNKKSMRRRSRKKSVKKSRKRRE